MSSELLSQLVTPWYESLGHPNSSQEETLTDLLQGYSRTGYAEALSASSVVETTSYRKVFPITNYSSLKPYFDRVRSGDYKSLLPEPVVRWVMTRGSTGRSKEIPATETHLGLILSAGARAIVNFGLRRGSAVLERPVLNLNFPSVVGTIDGLGPIGYSSGTYAKLNPGLGLAELIPPQDDIDMVGPGISKQDWERRFELVYERAGESDVGSTMGVTPVILAFARYLKRRHGVLAKSLWNMDALFCTSVAKIQTAYAPVLRHYFGPVPIVEMYTATEGVFAQQLDEFPYVCPNYDCYFFEVRTRNGVKMLHEMRRGEWGSLVVSTPILPRYEIGDLIEAEGKGYFRVLGRRSRKVAAEHMLYNALAFRRF